MKIAYHTPIETGRKHIKNIFRKQPKIIKKTCKTIQRSTKFKNKAMPHRKTKSKTSSPQENAQSK